MSDNLHVKKQCSDNELDKNNIAIYNCCINAQNFHGNFNNGVLCTSETTRVGVRGLIINEG